MGIRTIRHKGLYRLFRDGDGRGLPAASVDKINVIVHYLDELKFESELNALKSWKLHKLTGNQKGCYALSVTANWRIVFSIALNEGETGKIDRTVDIVDLDFEDYH